ncbi:MAG: hypothetical protein L6Q34_02240 [Nitrospira sp.]|nr:MAG: hypothetical protein UZ03_NOB001002766 [Nitrospira sp. OLB3]MCK6492228.1 hypothetical protein [Nitrospira sp.]MCK6498709.1 hypothetical protein [Nitrospira sp.]MEB2339070.1 hypothetical protein [Nitrospirales bacterium]
MLLQLATYFNVPLRRPQAMRPTRRFRLDPEPLRFLTAFAVCFFAVGLPYWWIPVRRLTLPDALTGPGLFVVGAAALILGWSLLSRLWVIALVPAAAVPAAVWARILVDGWNNPSVHHVWALELSITEAAGLFCAGLGALLGRLLRRLSRSRRP